VIDGNGQGVLFSRTSANNLVEHNIITNPALRYNVEDFELSGDRNVARRNCLWSTRHPDSAGVQPGIKVQIVDNVVAEPAFAGRDGKDFRLATESPCFGYSTGSRRPGPGE
jgi:hypothetical protein